MYCTQCGANVSNDARFCQNCGVPTVASDTELAGPRTDSRSRQKSEMANVQTPPIEIKVADGNQPYAEIAGWLWFLCVMLVVVFPLLALLYSYWKWTLLSILTSLADQSDWLLVVCESIATLALLAYGAYVGASVWSVKANALAKARTYGWCILVYSLGILLLTLANDESPYNYRFPFPQFWMPDSILTVWTAQIIQGVVTFAIGYPYLKWSTRVRSTFPTSSDTPLPPVT